MSQLVGSVFFEDDMALFVAADSLRNTLHDHKQGLDVALRDGNAEWIDSAERILAGTRFALMKIEIMGG
ncbi:hypothetical protein O1O06_11820 [Grimontia hollisae]|uniref:hypothetical protein n=1 Tax=Grimontia hollisae TaxID=673 RepID=UPI0023D9DDA1|nr:hypothetical protein [Grimontia hollisae]MDF2185450.1 hypothetical protein [Grimontia hollisae]